MQLDRFDGSTDSSAIDQLSGSEVKENEKGLTRRPIQEQHTKPPFSSVSFAASK